MAVARARRPRRVRPEDRPGRRRRAGLPDARRQGRRAHRAGDRVPAMPHEAVPRVSRTGAADIAGMRRAAGGAPAVLRRAHRAAGNPHAGRRFRGRHRSCSRAGSRAKPGAASGSWCRSAARSAGCSISRRATRRWRTRRGSTRTSPPTTTRSRRCARCSACRAVPRRIECFDISTIQGSETVASMVVCEDGRMKRSEYRKFRIRGNRARAASRAVADETARATIADIAQPCRAPAARGRSSSRERAAPGRGSSAFLNDFASMHEVVLRRYRKVLENGGPFPDLILIDGGKGQLSAAYAALEELGLGEPGRGRHRQERGAAVHARSRGADRAARRTVRRCCSSSASATKRTASPSRSIGSRGRSAICGRSSTDRRASGRGGARRCSRRSAASPACAARRARS